MNPLAMMILSTLFQQGAQHFLGQKQQMPQQPGQVAQSPQPQQGPAMAQQQSMMAGQQMGMNPALQMLLQIIQQGRTIG